MTLLIVLVLGVIAFLVIKSLLARGGADRRHPDADYTPGLIDTPATDDGHHHHSADCNHHSDCSHSHDSGGGDSSSSDSGSH